MICCARRLSGPRPLDASNAMRTPSSSFTEGASLPAEKSMTGHEHVLEFEVAVVALDRSAGMRGYTLS